jgi:hypothetical protein
MVRLVSAFHGLLFFGIEKPKQMRPATAVQEEEAKKLIKFIGSLYPLALYTVLAYRLLRTLTYGSGVEAASPVPLGSVFCFCYTLPLSLFAYLEVVLD